VENNLIIVNDNKPLWKAYGGISISNKDSLSIESISSYIKVLSKKETSKIVNAFNNEMYDMSIEYAWNRAMKKLDSRLEIFGLNFIAEMVGQLNIDSIDSISKKEKINLAFELGMIDNTAQIKLIQANELINHYMSDNVDDEMGMLDSLKIIVDITQYILGNDIDVNSIEFKTFREDLKSKQFKSSSSEVELLKSSPYFFIKTTIRTLLNLIKTTEDIEKTLVLNNSIIFIENLWDNLFIEDKKNIGQTYAISINDGDKEIFRTFSTILEKVQGYDFVPETTRSNAYIKVAKEYISIHYSMNNFYNEAAYAKKLNNMGSVIPDFALSQCLEAVIISVIGNKYGIATAAQSANREILKKITYEQWKEFFSCLILENQNILEDLKFSDNSMINRWYKLVQDYVPKDFNLKDKIAQKIYNYSIDNNNKLKNEASLALSKIIGK